MNRTEFYARVRPIFGGTLSQKQVDGIEALLAATEALPVTHRAYLLARADLACSFFLSRPPFAKYLAVRSLWQALHRLPSAVW